MIINSCESRKKTSNTTRANIEDNEVTFENAWGVCYTDIYNKVLKEAYKNETSFFDFVMTPSSHKPYTYPEGVIDIPSGSGRNGAVKYTDYAIGEFIKKAKQKKKKEMTQLFDGILLLLSILDGTRAPGGGAPANFVNEHLTYKHAYKTVLIYFHDSTLRL